MTPEEHLQQYEARFAQTTDSLLSLMTLADETAFVTAFRQAHGEYLTASNEYRFALYDYAKTLRNPEVGEVYTKKADDLFTQTPFLISSVLGYRKRNKL